MNKILKDIVSVLTSEIKLTTIACMIKETTGLSNKKDGQRFLMSLFKRYDFYFIYTSTCKIDLTKAKLGFCHSNPIRTSIPC